MQADYMKAFKNVWMITPRNQKEKAICALTTPNKPQSAEWADFEIWWNNLNAQEKGKAISDFLLLHS